MGIIFDCYTKNKESARWERGESNIAAGKNFKIVTSAQIVGQRLEGLMPDGVTDIKLEGGTKLATMKRNTVFGQLTTRS